MMTINGVGQCLLGYGAEIHSRVTPKRTLYNEATVGSHLECSALIENQRIYPANKSIYSCIKLPDGSI